MKYLKIKDQFKRELFYKFEIKKLLSKSMLQDLQLSYDLRGIIFNIIKRYSVSSKVIQRNRCIFSNKARSVFIRYKLSRLSFKRLVVVGKITGVRRIS
jgi:ribosomal protein S14